MDFEKICRLCLEEGASMQEIYGGDEHELLKEVFGKILQIEIHEDDQLPQQLCEQCLTVVTKLDETIRTYRENDEKLRKLLLESVQVKHEFVECDMEVEYLLEFSQTKVEEIDQGESLEISNELEEVDQDESLKISNDLESNYVKASDELLVNIDTETKRKPKGRKRKERFPYKPKMGNLRCYVCKSESFVNAEALLAHLGEHSGELPYTCTICVQKTVIINTVASLNAHKRMHANPAKCPHCDSRFANKRSIDLHITMLHQELAPDDKPSTCLKCLKVFPSAKDLLLHKSSHAQPMACEICGKLFKAKKQLTQHLNRVHNEARRVECHICHKKIGTMGALRNHISVIHSNEQFKCKFCPRHYPSKTSLTYYEKQHELNPNFTKTMSNNWKEYYTVEGEKGSEVKTCKLCGIVLGKVVRQHYVTKHFPQAKPKYHCDQCDAVFRLTTDLEIHKLEHSQGKILKCPICSREFAEKCQLVVHMKTKKHKDHPLAKSLDWINKDLPVPLPKRIRLKVV